MQSDRESTDMIESFDEKDLIHQNWSGWNNEIASVRVGKINAFCRCDL